MRIGSDYKKIEFETFGLDLLEPNAMFGDAIIFFIALFIAFKIGKMPIQSPFFFYWRVFFVIFGVGFLFGGLGHLLYNYLGVSGKYISWYSGIFAVFFIERAMLSIHHKEGFKRFFFIIISVKLLAALLGATLVFVLVDLETDPSLGLRVTTLNTIVGLFFALGNLGYKYSKHISTVFKTLYISVLILVPTVFLQTMKISFHPWFDRNDASHVLLIAGLIMYYTSIKAYQKHLSDKH